jgi:hypothetical protein
MEDAGVDESETEEDLKKSAHEKNLLPTPSPYEALRDRKNSYSAVADCELSA